MIRLITSDKFFKEEHDLVHALFESGLMELQVRKPNADNESIRNWIHNIDDQYHNRLVVYQDHSLLLNDFKGVHHRGFENENCILSGYSKSCHSIDEITRFSSRYDYLLLSPIFESISKIGYSSNAKWELDLIGENNRKKLIALGGVEKNKLKELKALGFEHIALLGAIWTSSSPIATFKDIREEWERIAPNY